MRLKNTHRRLLVLSIVFFFITRYHLLSLVSTLRTYAAFHTFLSNNPEALYRYESPPTSRPSHQPALVPKIIHQIYLTDNNTSTSTPITKYAPAINSCIHLHQSWTHNLWTDETASSFLAEHYPRLYRHYTSYKQTVQRANILRYAVLDHFGGVYLDLDVTCLVPLDGLRGVPWLAPAAWPVGVSNGFLLSRKGHAFWGEVLGELERGVLGWGLPYVDTMLGTGCMFLSTRWLGYARSLLKQGGSVREEDRVFVLADERGDTTPHMLRGLSTTPLFHHSGASSWHAWDAPAIVLIGAHYYYFLFMMGLGALSAMGMIWRFSKRAEARRRRWMGVRSYRDVMDKGSMEEVMITHRPFALC